MSQASPRIVLLGGTGMIGRALQAALGPAEVTLLRSRRRGPGGYDVATGWMDADTLQGADAIVNLAGSPIAVRWTASAREEIRSSRAGTTHLLVDTLNRAGIAPRVVVSMSGANRYAAHPEAELDASAPIDDTSFLGGVCRDWEAPLARLAPTTRVAILRTGVVIGPGGAMAKLAPVFRLGLGGRLGDGRQWMPWISQDGLVRLIQACLSEEGPSGVINAVETPIRNLDFTAAIGRVMRRPTLLPVPRWALRLAYGQMAEETLLASRRVVPTVALGEGSNQQPQGPAIDRAIASALGG